MAVGADAQQDQVQLRPLTVLSTDSELVLRDLKNFLLLLVSQAWK